MDIKNIGISRVLVELKDGATAAFDAGKYTYVTSGVVHDVGAGRDTWTVNIHNLTSAELYRDDAPNWQTRAEAAERRVAELESQLAATAWRPMDGEDYPRDPNQKIQMIVNGYCGEREEWQTDIGQEIMAPYRCIRGWRPIDTSQEAQ